MFGLINLHKPPGITSRKALNQVQQLVKPHKVGHAGTLDPLAEGVLVVTVGPATRLTPRIQAWRKTYLATFLLGRHSETEDIEGSVVELDQPRQPSWEELAQAFPSLTGVIQQRPPAYSALKIKGKRAYQRARSGERVEMKSREITVHSLELVRYTYPELTVRVVCGSGTYVRALGRDLAQAVGTEAVMSKLIRTRVGHLDLEHAVRPASLTRDNLCEYLLSARHAVADLPSLQLSVEQAKQLSFGGEIVCTQHDAPEVAALTSEGDLAAVLVRRRNQTYRPHPNFIAAG